MTTHHSILLVEDNEDDVFLMERALQGAGIVNRMNIAQDGQEAIDYLSGTHKYCDRSKYPIPAVVFLDLKLPLKSGHQVLEWIRNQKELQSLVVVVLTSSAEPKDVKQSYELGANSFIVKPPKAEDLLDLAKSFKWYWLEFNRFDEEKKA